MVHFCHYLNSQILYIWVSDIHNLSWQYNTPFKSLNSGSSLWMYLILPKMSCTHDDKLAIITLALCGWHSTSRSRNISTQDHSVIIHSLATIFLLNASAFFFKCIPSTSGVSYSSPWKTGTIGFYDLSALQIFHHCWKLRSWIAHLFSCSFNCLDP